ncbi:MAG: hypothetical protein QW165_03220 [Candidatus Woesearchaeota archaeon]
MKTNYAIKSLCSLVGMCRPDIDDLGRHSNGETAYFQAQYRNVCIFSAMLELPEVRDLQIPSQKGNFKFRNSHEKSSLRGIHVTEYYNKQNEYVSLDGFVNAGGLPTLVEMRMAKPENICHYFRNIERKLAVLDTLFPVCKANPDGYGWVLMLPCDYLLVEPHPIPAFRRNGGEIAILPFTAAELHEAVEKYAPHDSDTKVFVNQ